MDRFLSAHARRFAQHRGQLRTQMHGRQINVIQKGYIMFRLSATYQRSTEGRHEIVRKSCGLTQSERLTLILVDGINPASQVRGRVPGLDDESFRQVMDKLLSMGLIEVSADLAPAQVRKTCKAPVRSQDGLATITVVRNDPYYDFSVAAIAATADFSSLCPTASAALVLEEWTKLRGWHVRSAAPEAEATAAARLKQNKTGITAVSSLYWSLITKRYAFAVDQTPLLIRTGQSVTDPDAGKQPVAIKLLLCIAALLTRTMAIVRGTHRQAPRSRHGHLWQRQDCKNNELGDYG